MVDLHIHTTASDGWFTPSEVISQAKEKRLTTIAITDHNTIDGIIQLENIKNYGINIIPGIEMYTDENDLHILGYNIDIDDEKLKKKLRYLAVSYISSITSLCKIIYKKYNIYIPICFEGKIVKKKFIASKLIETKIVSSYNMAYELLDYTYQGIDPPKQLNYREVIQTIHDARGIAVLAHPGRLLKKYSWSDVKYKLEDMIRNGLEGVECFNPIHSKAEEQLFLDYSLENQLYITGGSDYHGKLNEQIGEITKESDIDEIQKYLFYPTRIKE